MDRDTLIALVQAAQGGDGDAMNELFGAFYDDVYYFALKTLKNDELAMEICQETFLEVIETLQNLREPAAFVTWLKRIAYHRCTAYFKKKKEILVEEDEEGHSLFDDVAEEREDFIPGSGLEREDFKQTVLAMLDTLSEEQRSAVMLHYYNQMSVAEIASVQGVSEGTVKSRLNYARRAIRVSVEDYERKHGVKLHAIPLFPLMGWVLENTSAVFPRAAREGVAAAVSTAAGGGSAAAVAGTAGAVGAAGTGAAVSAGAVTAAAVPLAAKIAAGVIAATVLVGGGAGGYYLATRGDDEPAFATVEGEVRESEDGERHLSGELPEGCVYVCADGTVLEEGDAFPSECREGDIVLYGDYSYTYEGIINPDYVHTVDDPDFTNLPEGEVILMKNMQDVDDMGMDVARDMLGGWYPQITDPKKEHYGEICATINKKPIRALYITFMGSALKDAGTVKVPSTVEWMIGTFWACEELVTAKELKIPPSVWNASLLFHECASLKEAPLLPATLRWVNHVFWHCHSLTGDIEIVLDPEECEGFLSDTRAPVNLVGEKLSVMATLASTATENNVSINGVPFSLSRPTPAPQDPDDTRILQEYTSFHGMTQPYKRPFYGAGTESWCIRPVLMAFYPDGGDAYDPSLRSIETEIPFVLLHTDEQYWYVPQNPPSHLQGVKAAILDEVAKGSYGVPRNASWEELFENEGYFLSLQGRVLDGEKYVLYVPSVGTVPDFYAYSEEADGTVSLSVSPALKHGTMGVRAEKVTLAADGLSLTVLLGFDDGYEEEMTLKELGSYLDF